MSRVQHASGCDLAGDLGIGYEVNYSRTLRALHLGLCQDYALGGVVGLVVGGGEMLVAARGGVEFEVALLCCPGGSQTTAAHTTRQPGRPLGDLAVTMRVEPASSSHDR